MVSTLALLSTLSQQEIKHTLYVFHYNFLHLPTRHQIFFHGTTILFLLFSLDQVQGVSLPSLTRLLFPKLFH